MRLLHIGVKLMKICAQSRILVKMHGVCTVSLCAQDMFLASNSAVREQL